MNRVLKLALLWHYCIRSDLPVVNGDVALADLEARSSLVPALPLSGKLALGPGKSLSLDALCARSSLLWEMESEVNLSIIC